MCLWWVFMYPWGHTAVIRSGSHLTKMLFITEGLSLYGGIIFASWCVTPLSSTKMEKKLGEIFRTINVLILPNLILVTFYLPFLSFFLVSGCSTKFVIFCGCGLVCGGDWLGKYRSIKETLKCFLNIVTKRCCSRGSRFFWTCQATIVAVQAAGKLHLKERYCYGKALARSNIKHSLFSQQIVIGWSDVVIVSWRCSLAPAVLPLCVELLIQSGMDYPGFKSASPSGFRGTSTGQRKWLSSLFCLEKFNPPAGTTEKVSAICFLLL